MVRITAPMSKLDAYTFDEYLSYVCILNCSVLNWSLYIYLDFQESISST